MENLKLMFPKVSLEVVKYLRKTLHHAPLTNPTYASQPGFTCSKLTIETLEQDVKYIQS